MPGAQPKNVELFIRSGIAPSGSRGLHTPSIPVPPIFNLFGVGRDGSPGNNGHFAPEPHDFSDIFPHFPEQRFWFYRVVQQFDLEAHFVLMVLLGHDYPAMGYFRIPAIT